MPDFNQIGNALAGFGAGVQGNLPQFMAVQQAKKEKLSEERRRMAALDLLEGRNRLNRAIESGGDLSDFNAFGQERVSAIQQLGGDPVDTISDITLANENPLAAMTKFDDALMRAQAEGVIKLPANFGPQKDTTLVQNLLAAGYTKGSPEMQAAILANVNKPGTSLTVNNGQEKVDTDLLVQMGKSDIERYDEKVKKANAAQEVLASVRTARNLDISQGAGVEMRVAIARGASALGIDMEDFLGVDVANIQAYESVTEQVINDLMSAASGTQTADDERRFKKSFAQVGNEAEANAFILNMTEATAMRRIEEADFIQEHVYNSTSEREGRKLYDANKAWAKYIADTPNLSSSVKTASGLPMFFYQFRENARRAVPDATDEQIAAQWRLAQKVK
jgi:hypothetical protein